MLQYESKRPPSITFRDALLRGQAPDRGLYMPERVPMLTSQDADSFRALSYPELAHELSMRWLGDELDQSCLKQICTTAYAWPVPVKHITENVFVLELWHGPSHSFKDFAAQWLGRIVHVLRKTNELLTVLVATSGDTGSAVAAGFHKLPHMRVVVLYPSGKVSKLQEQQLTTFGGNVEPLEITGTFDDCQRMVKEAFADAELRGRIALTSANSINIARLIPQTFYYIWAYIQILNNISSLRTQSKGEVAFCVPSGNLGNLTGGLLAMRMGIPVKKFIAATNANAVMPEFISTAKFSPRPSLQTLSNAMDVGNPSNFARVFDLYARDAQMPAAADNVEMEQLRNNIWSTSVDDQATREAIKEVDERYHYVMDPHTAVGWKAIERWRETGEGRAFRGPLILLSTAHPAKFMDSIERVLPKDAVAMPQALNEALRRPKRATQMPADYPMLKKYLDGTANDVL